LLLKGPPKSGETQQARTKRIKALCEVLEEKIALRYPIFKRSVYRIFRPAMPGKARTQRRLCVDIVDVGRNGNFDHQDIDQPSVVV
jgi:hypothetical protein